MLDCSGIKKDSVVTVTSYFGFSDMLVIVSANRSNLVSVWSCRGYIFLGGSAFRFKMNAKDPLTL